MALNPPMFDATMPFAQVGEFFLCSRHGLSFEVTTPGLPKLKSRRGLMFLTTSRIVFVSQPPVQLGNGAPPFVSFELPLRGLTAEKFNQPVFGANYLSGRAACVPGMGLTGDASFSLTFNEGGAGTFLSLFFRALAESRLPAEQASAHATLRSTVIATGSFRELAVIDPNDPSIIYVTQPAIPTAPLAQGQGQGQGREKSGITHLI
jgi:hypothetical protein